MDNPRDLFWVPGNFLGMRKPTSRPRAAIATSIALAGALLVSVTGCAAAPTASPAGSAAPSATTPLFASDAEALAAATAAYSKYLEVSDQIARDGGANPERLKPYVSASLFQNEVATYTDVAARGLHATGATTFDTLHIQAVTANSVQVYACARADRIRVMNSAGVDVTPSDRASVVPLSLVWTQGDGTKLILDSSDRWTGVNFCR